MVSRRQINAAYEPDEFLLRLMPACQAKLIGSFIYNITGSGASRKSNALWAIACEHQLRRMLRNGLCGYHEVMAASGRVIRREWFATPGMSRLGRVKLLRVTESVDGQEEEGDGQHRGHAGEARQPERVPADLPRQDLPL